MVMDSNRQQRDYDKFVETNKGDTAVRTLLAEHDIPITDPIPVTVTSATPDTASRKYGTALVTHNTEATLVTYTVPTSNTYVLTGLNIFGEADGEFIIYVNSIVQMTVRNSPSEPSKFLTINDNNFELTGDDILDIKVTNCSNRQNAANYDATIIGGVV